MDNGLGRWAWAWAWVCTEGGGEGEARILGRGQAMRMGAGDVERMSWCIYGSGELERERERWRVVHGASRLLEIQWHATAAVSRRWEVSSINEAPLTSVGNQSAGHRTDKVALHFTDQGGLFTANRNS